MEKSVSAADANRKFSKLLRAVREGHSYVVTSHGKAVAKIVPVDKNGGVARGPRPALVKRLGSEALVTNGPRPRGEVYEDNPSGLPSIRTLWATPEAQTAPPRLIRRVD